MLFGDITLRGNTKGEIKIMSRWQIEGNADYYTRYRNYETYLRANAGKLGLSAEQVNEQLGRYAQGLQQKMQVEPGNIQVGREIARNPQAYGIMNPNEVTQKLEDAQRQLQKLTANLGDGATSTTYFGTTDQLRSAAPLGNIAPDVTFESEFKKSQLYKSTKGQPVQKLGKRKQQQIADEIEKLARLAKTPEERKLLEERVAKFRGGNDKALFNKVLQENKPAVGEPQIKAEPQKPEAPKTWKQYAEAHGTKYTAPAKSGILEAEKRAQEIIARNELASKIPAESKPQIQEAPKQIIDDIAKPGANLADDAAVNIVDDITDDAVKSFTNTADDIADNLADDVAKGAEHTKSTGFLSNVKNAMKGKKGKVALIAAGAAALIGGGIALFGGKKDEEVPQQQPGLPAPGTAEPDKPVVTPENPTDTVPEQPTPVVTQPQPEPEPVVAQEPEYDEYTVKKGDHFWGLAKQELIEAHKDDPNYKPTDKEILELAEQIMKDNKYGFDDDHWYPDPMLMPGDKLKLRKIA